jgi:CheY-like chemotaxis protein
VAEILVVDDDTDIREVVGTILESDGYDVRTAENGAEALARVEEHAPDLILLDLRMPVMDGPEFQRRMRTIDPDRRVPVVVMSAFADLEAASPTIECSARLQKPFDIGELSEVVTRALAEAS